MKIYILMKPKTFIRHRPGVESDLPRVKTRRKRCFATEQVRPWQYGPSRRIHQPKHPVDPSTNLFVENTCRDMRYARNTRAMSGQFQRRSTVRRKARLQVPKSMSQFWGFINRFSHRGCWINIWCFWHVKAQATEFIWRAQHNRPYSRSERCVFQLWKYPRRGTCKHPFLAVSRGEMDVQLRPPLLAA